MLQSKKACKTSKNKSPERLGIGYTKVVDGILSANMLQYGVPAAHVPHRNGGPAHSTGFLSKPAVAGPGHPLMLSMTT